MKSANPRLAALRARKAALLPRAAALAGEGRPYDEIAATLGVAKSTICNWLCDRPLGRAAAKAPGTPRMTARLAARYESLYHRAMREWNRSRTDRRTESVVTVVPAGGSPTTKTTVRTEPRIGHAACLGKALAALLALEGLHCRERSRRERLEEFASGAAAGKEGGVTRTVKTTLTPSGRKVQTVVTTRSGAGGSPRSRTPRQRWMRSAAPWRRDWRRPQRRQRRTRLRTRRCARHFAPRPTRPRRRSRLSRRASPRPRRRRTTRPARR